MQKKPPKSKVHIFVISDSTGMTAEMVINSVLIQFKGLKPVFRKFPFTRTKEQIKAVLDEANSVKGIVIYSLVSRELRTWVRSEKRTAQVYAIDLIGPILDSLQKQWNLTPLFEPGLLRGIGADSLRVAESIDFTLNHDDGQGVQTLGKADLIILGVSRTSKTPTSLYLACNHGLKVANVPIINGIKPPDKIFTLKNQKIGLIIEPERLAFLRKNRWKNAGAMEYVNISHISREMIYCEKIFARIKGLRVIDVSYSSIEEVSGSIMEFWRKARN